MVYDAPTSNTDPTPDTDQPPAEAPEVSVAADAYSHAAEELSGHRGPAPLNEVVTTATSAYLDLLDPDDPPTARTLENELLGVVKGLVRLENQKTKVATEKLPYPRVLTTWQVAQILLRLHRVIRIAPKTLDTDREYDLLAMYVATGRDRGTYTTSEDDMRTTARRYNTSITLKEFNEVVAVLREASQRRTICARPDLIAVSNGIFNYGKDDLDLEVEGRTFHLPAKTLVDFDPDLIFLTKCRVNYVENAPRVVIPHPIDGDWEVTEWIREFYQIDGDDEFNRAHEGMAELIWEILGALVRPHVSWNKTAWFYSESGNNGKGTLCALMRNLVGAGSHTSIPLSDFGKDFALEPLVRANAIIVDENDVGTFIDKAANLKAIVTNDVIQINRKYRMPIAYQFHGFMVQCLNEFPRVKDKSESFYRRQLFVPFEKCFTGKEKRYIKDDYLHRREVLEYVLWYVLNEAGSASPGSYYELSEPQATKNVLAEYKEVNDPVRAFWEEFRLRLVWKLAPFTFLYDLYKEWLADVSPSGSPVSRNQFITDLVSIVRDDTLWHCPDKGKRLRPGRMMDAAEPLIAEYNLTRWMDPHYAGGRDPLKKCHPVLQGHYRGLLRGVGGTTGDQVVADPED